MSANRYCLIMPFLNEAVHLPDVLASLAGQTLDPAAWRLVAVDNGSTDGGETLVRRWLAEGGRHGTLVADEVRSIPHALNVGIAQAREDEFVVRIDAHTIYGPDYLATIDRSFRELPASVWCVGGAPTPRPERQYGRALGVALYSNPFGLGPADFRAPNAAPTPVTTVYLGAWRPTVLQRLGGFDEAWLANEDCELTERIAAAGGRVYRVPVDCLRIATRGPVATVRQWSRYGFWRAQTFKRYPRAIRPRHVIAPVVLLGALALSLSRSRVLLVPLYALYALGTIACRSRGERAAVTAGTLAFFPAVHVTYALGLLVGAVRSPRGA